MDSTCLASGKILIIAQPSPTDDEVRARRRKSVLDGGFQFEVPTEDAMRRDLPRIGARQLPRGGPTLIALFSLNLVINYEREIIINICLPRLSLRPWTDLQRALPLDRSGLEAVHLFGRETIVDRRGWCEVQWEPAHSDPCTRPMAALFNIRQHIKLRMQMRQQKQQQPSDNPDREMAPSDREWP